MRIDGKIGLGTVQFGLSYGISNTKGKTPAQEVCNILETARANKIDVLDSASAYGNSEQVLGNFDISTFKVISKFLPPSNDESISLQFNNSLKNLGLDSLYAYLAHRPIDLLNNPSHWEELKQFKRDAKIEKIGFSLNEPEELMKLLDKGFFPDLIQVPYNYLDRRFESLMKGLHAKGCEIHTRSTFLQGLFFINADNLAEYFNEVKPILRGLQEDHNLNGNLLKFVLEKSFIDRVIIGVENKMQLQSNIGSLEEANKLPLLQRGFSDNILIPSRWPK